MRLKWRVMIFRTASLRLAQVSAFHMRLMSAQDARGPNKREKIAPLEWRAPSKKPRRCRRGLLFASDVV
jgi:hypothetical protein